MERIRIAMPDNFTFSTSIPIRITDINYGDHVGNDTFLALIHEARIQFLQHYGYTELQFAGAGLIMADVALEFKLEILYGHTVTIYVAAAGFDKLGFDIFYKLVVLKNGQEKTAGKAKTGMICFDYNAKKKVPIPAEALAIFQKQNNTGYQNDSLAQ